MGFYSYFERLTNLGASKGGRKSFKGRKQSEQTADMETWPTSANMLNVADNGLMTRKASWVMRERAEWQTSSASIIIILTEPWEAKRNRDGCLGVAVLCTWLFTCFSASQTNEHWIAVCSMSQSADSNNQRVADWFFWFIRLSPTATANANVSLNSTENLFFQHQTFVSWRRRRSSWRFKVSLSKKVQTAVNTKFITNVYWAKHGK